MSAPVAILDIGSNSVRFAILERGQEGAFFVPGNRKSKSSPTGYNSWLYAGMGWQRDGQVPSEGRTRICK